MRWMHDLYQRPPSATLQCNELANQNERDGLPVYRLGFGQSPFSPPADVIAALQAHAHCHDYLPVQGLEKLRHAVASFYEPLLDKSLSPNNIIIGPGSKQLIYMALAAFKHADLFLVTPSWVSYAPQAEMLGHDVHWLETSQEENYRLSPRILEQALKKRAGRSPAILILNYPGNPDGQTYNEQTLASLAAVAKKYELLIIADEIYGLLDHNGQFSSIINDYPEGTLVTTGLSKWCGAGGWRLGAAYYSGCQLEPLKQAMLGIASETHSACTAPVQYAACIAYQHTEQRLAYIHKQRQILKYIGNEVSQQLSQMGIHVAPPQGGFYLTLSFSAFQKQLGASGIHDSQMLCHEIVEKTGVMLLPGSEFGFSSSALTARLAYVDFNGDRALQLSPSNYCLAEIAPNINRAMGQLSKWCSELMGSFHQESKENIEIAF